MNTYKPGPLSLLVLLAGILMNQQSATASPTDIIPFYPDTCTRQTTTDGSVLAWYYSDYGTEVRIYGKAAMARPGRYKRLPVVVIINGNAIAASEYNPLSDHLVKNEYVVIAINRRNTNDASDPQLNDILDQMEELFFDYRIDSTSPVALVGHSVGGGVAMKLSQMINQQNRPFNLQAVSTLAPNPAVFIGENNRLTAEDTPAYLGLYGSQDGDMTGMGVGQDAFTAYDHVGNEWTTSDPAFPNPDGELFKSMIFIHGADHMGLIGSDLSEGNGSINEQFVSTDDQFCITKAYLTAFLNWRVQEKLFYKSYLTPPYVYTQSVQNITTESADYMGNVATTNPAGSPLRMFFQTSPVNRQALQNFEYTWINDFEVYLNFGWMFKTNDLNAYLLQEDEFKTAPFYIRNVTRKLMVAWESMNSWQHLGFNVFGKGRKASDHTHLSIRMGQVWNQDYPEFVNPPGAYQEAYVVLVDGQGQQAFTLLDYWGDIPFSDVRYSGSSGHSVMSTISVPLYAFNDINKDDIRMVAIIFKPNTSGLMMVDNLEWVTY